MAVVYQILQILGSLGVFLYGMKLMSEGIQNAAGDKLRNILKGMTKNRYLGIFTGFLITALIQSSSATTVMVVSFVNAGLLTLTESIGVIMGANIGTTVTLWIIAVLGKFNITAVAIALIGISFPFLFSKKEKTKHFAEFLLGFGILFIGLDFLKNSVPDINSNPEILSFVKSFTSLSFPYASILLFVLLGTVMTLIVQSSSAASAITLTLLIQGWIPFELACAMVLGENIGTTVTANIAAAIANVHAKRAARFHFLFNIIGVVWMLIIFKPYTHFIASFLNSDFFQSLANFAGKDNYSIGMAIFHTTFNLINVIILMWFINILAKMVIKMVPTVKDEDEEFHLTYIGSGIMAMPTLSVANAKNELNNFGKLIEKMSGNVYSLFYEKQKDDFKLIEKIKKREELTDKLDEELSQFLSKVAEEELNIETAKEIRQILTISNELERIGDIMYELCKNYERLKRESVQLPDNAKDELKDLVLLTNKAISLMHKNIVSNGKD
ncbi:MAG: Na/Pi cotransporter family protein, partial [Bacteroidetes bacterium]|nr:Na/Pi cotransporter family protein [Bacteroidota bacterium]